LVCLFGFLGTQKFTAEKQKEAKTTPIQKAKRGVQFKHVCGLRRKAFFFGAGIMSRDLSA